MAKPRMARPLGSRAELAPTTHRLGFAEEIVHALRTWSNWMWCVAPGSAS